MIKFFVNNKTMSGKSVYTKKAAIFGMDARIAMLIIAILSALVYPIVSGVISKSMAEAIIASARSSTVAIENYIADTGKLPSANTELYTSSETNWNGPYLKGNPDDRFSPDLSWSLEDNSCAGTGESRYCTYKITYSFCKFSKAVSEVLKNYFSNASQAVNYVSATECIELTYGYADNGGSTTYVKFKVKEAL